LEWVKTGRWALPAIYLGAAILLTNIYWQSTQQLATATLAMFVAGVANKPFAYRILMPTLLGITAEANGLSLQLADIALRVLILTATMLLLRRWLRHFIHPLLADVMPLLLGVMLPWSFLFYWPYDFAGILIWTACLLCLVERRYATYLLLFTLGTLNRETAIFLIGLFGLTQWDLLGPRRTLQWCAGQAAIWLTVFVGLRLLIHPTGGDAVEFHLLANLDYLLHGQGFGPLEHWVRLLSGLGFMWVLAFWHWRRKSPFLRRACWLFAPYFLVMLVVARFVETRVWYEWIPIVLALSGQTLAEFHRNTGGASMAPSAVPPAALPS